MVAWGGVVSARIEVPVFGCALTIVSHPPPQAPPVSQYYGQWFRRKNNGLKTGMTAFSAGLSAIFRRISPKYGTLPILDTKLQLGFRPVRYHPHGSMVAYPGQCADNGFTQRLVLIQRIGALSD
jgi:hypothetical protein